jgi:hypothetical protein
MSLSANSLCAAYSVKCTRCNADDSERSESTDETSREERRKGGGGRDIRPSHHLFYRKSMWEREREGKREGGE